MPKVSIIIPVFNRPDLVTRAILSALRQTFSDIEVIVVDNASTDTTYLECCRIAESDARVRVFKNSENVGPVRNWFKCLEHVRAPYVKFLFSDDLLREDCIEKLLPALGDPACGFAYSTALIGTADWSGQESYVFTLDDSRIPSQTFIATSLSNWGLTPVSPGAALFRTEDIRKSLLDDLHGTEGYDFLSTGAGIDWLLYLLTADRHRYVWYVAEPLAFFRAHPGSISTMDAGANVIPGYQKAAEWFLKNRPLLKGIPRITAIVSTYKSADFIAECLDDLLAQTVADQLEIIVIDAASPENEKEIVVEYQKRHPRIRYHRTATRIGIYAAWNLAVGMAQGEYLISVSTNDRLRRNACQVLMQELDARPEVMVAYGDSLTTDIPHQTFEECTPNGIQSWPDYRFDLLLNNCMVGCHPMWRRQVHEKVGLFDEDYKAIGDQEMWLRIAEKFPLFHKRYVTGLYLTSPDSLSGNLAVAAQEIDRVRQKYRPRDKYRTWVARTTLSEVAAQELAERLSSRRQDRPHFLIIAVVGKEDHRHLGRTLHSLQFQFYGEWTFIAIADSPAPDQTFSSSDFLGWLEIDDVNDEDLVVTAANQLLGAIASDWILWLTPGTELAPEAMAVVCDYASLSPSWLAIYADHDSIDADGMRLNPYFKPDISTDYLRCMNYIGEAIWFSAVGVKELGGFRTVPGAWQFDAALRLVERAGEEAIGHVPHVLLHLSSAKTPHPLTAAAEQYAVETHLARAGVNASVEKGLTEGTRIIRYASAQTPLVSIVIPNKNALEFLEPCVRSLKAITKYKNFELIIVDNASDDPELLNFYAELSADLQYRTRIIPFNHEFNYSAMCNLGASAGQGELILFLNNDTQIVHEQWLDRMAAHVLRANVGIVGAKLVYPGSGKIQHAGIVIGMTHVADHPFIGSLDHDAPGYMNRAITDQNYSAVTGACMLVRRETFESIEGHNETDLPVSFSDVDLCLKATEAGWKVAWTPHAVVVHHGSVSQKRQQQDLEKLAKNQRRFAQERSYMISRWAHLIANDPAYNPNLSLIERDMSPEVDIPTNWDNKLAKRKRILGNPLQGGSGEYRMLQPFAALSTSGLAHCEAVHSPPGSKRIPLLSEMIRLAPDVLVLQSAIDDGELDLLAEIKTYLPKTKIIFSLDDLLTAVPEKSSFYRGFVGRFRDSRQRLRKALGYCHKLIVSTPFLEESCRDLIDDIVVIPNRLTRKAWSNLIPAINQGAKPRVGWAGAQQHQGDLELLEPIIRATHEEVDWVFMGMCPENVRQLIAEVHDFVAIDQYPAKLAALGLDIAIAPLEDHPFNRGKSNLRLLEYGLMGWPVICTDIEPYQLYGAPVTRLPNDPVLWIETIRRKVAARSQLHNEGQQLRAWVLENFILEDHLSDWAAALLE